MLQLYNEERKWSIPSLLHNRSQSTISLQYSHRRFELNTDAFPCAFHNHHSKQIHKQGKNTFRNFSTTDRDRCFPELLCGQEGLDQCQYFPVTSILRTQKYNNFFYQLVFVAHRQTHSHKYNTFFPKPKKKHSTLPFFVRIQPSITSDVSQNNLSSQWQVGGQSSFSNSSQQNPNHKQPLLRNVSPEVESFKFEMWAQSGDFE